MFDAQKTAKQLVEKFFSLSGQIHFSKEYASIHVEGIMEEIESWNFGVIDYTNRINHWKEVKKELKKL